MSLENNIFSLSMRAVAHASNTHDGDRLYNADLQNASPFRVPYKEVGGSEHPVTDPYINHLIRAGAMVYDALGATDPLMPIALLVHETPEHTNRFEQGERVSHGSIARDYGAVGVQIADKAVQIAQYKNQLFQEGDISPIPEGYADAILAIAADTARASLAYAHRELLPLSAVQEACADFKKALKACEAASPSLYAQCKQFDSQVADLLADGKAAPETLLALFKVNALVPAFTKAPAANDAAYVEQHKVDLLWVSLLEVSEEYALDRRRSGSTSFGHAAQTAILLDTYAAGQIPTATLAALWHDMLEDGHEDTVKKPAMLARMRKCVGDVVAAIVCEKTDNPDSMPYDPVRRGPNKDGTYWDIMHKAEHFVKSAPKYMAEMIGTLPDPFHFCNPAHPYSLEGALIMFADTMATMEAALAKGEERGQHVRRSRILEGTTLDRITHPPETGGRTHILRKLAEEGSNPIIHAMIMDYEPLRERFLQLVDALESQTAKQQRS